MRRNHFITVALSLMTMAFLYLPLIGVAVFSVNSARRGLVWKGFTLDWYYKLFENEWILEAAWNTLVLALVSTVIATILGTILAIGMDRFPWGKRTNGFLDIILHIPVVIPDIILAAALVVAGRAAKLQDGVRMAAAAISSIIHSTAKPVLRMPPGYRVEVAVSAMMLSGVIAARLGGRVWATNSWLIPGYDTPTMPTRPSCTQGWAATVSITS